MKNDQFYIDLKSTGGIVAQPFVIRMGLMTGKVIDHTQTIPSPPFSKVIDLDDELENLAATQAQRWWDCSLPTEPHEVTDFRARLVEHCVFFLSRMYLHLPCILKPRSSHLYSVSRKTGLDSTRQLIKRYHALRTPVNGESSFDCKTLDFIGFMASVVLVVGSSQDYASGCPLASSDGQLVKDTVSLLSQLAEEQNCTIAEQCCNCLTRLIKLCTAQDDDVDTMPTKFAIPYFGTLQVTSHPSRGRRTRPTTFLNDATQSSMSVETYPLPNPHETLGTGAGTLEAGPPAIEYQGLYSMDPNTNWLADASGLYTDSFSSMMDLDQDWDTFLYPGLADN